MLRKAAQEHEEINTVLCQSMEVHADAIKASEQAVNDIKSVEDVLERAIEVKKVYLFLTVQISPCKSDSRGRALMTTQIRSSLIYRKTEMRNIFFILVALSLLLSRPYPIFIVGISHG